MGMINKLKITLRFGGQKLKINFKKNKAFTLIEVIVVIGVIGIVLPVLFSIIFSILQQQTKIQRLSLVKKEGDYILNVIENVVRNYAVKIYSENSFINEKCASAGSTYGPENGNTFYFQDKYNRWFNFYLNSTTITSNSANLSSSVNLNSSQTKISSFSLQCYRSALYSPPIISINFTIEYNTNSNRAEEKIIPLTYQTKIKLKSY